MSDSISPWSGPGLAGAGAPGLPSLTPRQLAELTDHATRMRSVRIMSDFVGGEVSKLSLSMFDLTIDTLEQYAVKLERARPLNEVALLSLGRMQAQYLATMTGLSDSSSMQLCRMLEELPDLQSRRGLLEQLRSWLQDNR